MDDETREAILVLVVIVAFIIGAFLAAQIWINGQGQGSWIWTFWPNVIRLIIQKSHF